MSYVILLVYNQANKVKYVSEKLHNKGGKHEPNK